MPSVFLFADRIDDEGCLSLKLNDDGTILEAPEYRSFADISQSCFQAEVYIIISTLKVSIHEIELPLMNDKKARAAIPFSAEDRVAEPIEALFFAFDNKFHKQGKYLSIAINKSYLQELIDKLEDYAIPCKQITIDWFALQEEENYLLSSALLIRQPSFKGALSQELAAVYLDQHREESVRTFDDSAALDLPFQQEKTRGDSYPYLARALIKNPRINLRQGEFLSRSNAGTQRKRYWLTGGLALSWLLLVFFFDLYKIYYLNKETTKVDKQIAVIYKKFFPNDKKIINPRFRIQQLTGQARSTSSDQLWFLLSRMSEKIDRKNNQINKLIFQNNKLSINLLSSDFSALESFEHQLQEAGLDVAQIQAKSQDDKVISTLEIK